MWGSRISAPRDVLVRSDQDQLVSIEGRSRLFRHIENGERKTHGFRGTRQF